MIICGVKPLGVEPQSFGASGIVRICLSSCTASKDLIISEYVAIRTVMIVLL